MPRITIAFATKTENFSKMQSLVQKNGSFMDYSHGIEIRYFVKARNAPAFVYLAHYKILIITLLL